MSDGEEAEADTVSYQFEMNRKDWRDWTQTVPRREPLAARLRELIRQDRRAAARADAGEIEQKTVSLVLQRIRIRARGALGAVRDGDDEDAAERLEELIELTEGME